MEKGGKMVDLWGSESSPNPVISIQAVLYKRDELPVTFWLIVWFFLFVSLESIKMDIPTQNMSGFGHPGLAETRLIGKTDSASMISPVLTWPLWQYIVASILGIILYDQSK